MSLVFHFSVSFQTELTLKLSPEVTQKENEPESPRRKSNFRKLGPVFFLVLEMRERWRKLRTAFQLSLASSSSSLPTGAYLPPLRPTPFSSLHMRFYQFPVPVPIHEPECPCIRNKLRLNEVRLPVFSRRKFLTSLFLTLITFPYFFMSFHHFLFNSLFRYIVVNHFNNSF